MQVLNKELKLFKQTYKLLAKSEIQTSNYQDQPVTTIGSDNST
jgi:hypothetical protein